MMNNLKKAVRAFQRAVDPLDSLGLHYLIKDNQRLPTRITDIKFDGISGHTKKDLYLQFKMTDVGGGFERAILSLHKLKENIQHYNRDQKILVAVQDAFEHLEALEAQVKELGFARIVDLEILSKNPAIRFAEIDRLPDLKDRLQKHDL